MSWQSYVDNNLVATGKVSKGAIFGLDASTWGVSPDFHVNSSLRHLIFSHSSFQEEDEEEGALLKWSSLDDGWNTHGDTLEKTTQPGRLAPSSQKKKSAPGV